MKPAKNNLNKINAVDNDIIIEHQEFSHHNFFKGPVPSPETMKKYAQIYPDAPKRIFDLADKNQEFELEQKRKILETQRTAFEKNNEITKRGQWFIFILALGFLAAGFVCALLNKPIAATLFSIFPSALVIQYLMPNKNNK